MDDVPFWRRKTLAEMTQRRNGRACATAADAAASTSSKTKTPAASIIPMSVCRLLDGTTCRCKDYQHRSEEVEDCVRLTPDNVATI